MRINRSLACVIVAGFAATAAATDLSNNLSQATGGTENASGARRLSASFKTDAAAYQLSAITLLLANPTTGTATVSIYSDGKLEPGSLVGALTSPASYSSNLALATFGGNSIPLAANTTYWVVLQANSGSFDWAWSADDTGAGAGFLHTWGVSEDSGAFWWSYDRFPTQFSVVASVPGTCYANCDNSTGSPRLTANDFQCFIDAFASGLTYANCDGSSGTPTLTANDFQCFINAYATGCT